MSASALICLAPGSEETEAVTTIDLMVRGGINVTTASVASDGNLTITCSRGVKILADAPLVQVADGDYDIIVLPGGLKGAEYFRDSPSWSKLSGNSICRGASLRQFVPQPARFWCRITFSRSEYDRFPGTERDHS